MAELNNLVASCNKPLTTCQQAGNKQCEHILMTSCWNSIATSLLQICHNLCAFLCVYSSRTCMPAFRRMRFMFILAFIQASHHKTMTPLTHLYRWRNMSRTVLFPPSCCKPSRR
jgi:hypothetical protein